MAKLDDLLVKVQSAANEFLTELYAVYSEAGKVLAEAAPVSSGIATSENGKLVEAKIPPEITDEVMDAIEAVREAEEAYNNFQQDFAEGRETDSTKGAKLLNAMQEKGEALDALLKGAKTNE